MATTLNRIKPARGSTFLLALTLALLVLLLLCTFASQQVEATFLAIGFVCNAALATALRVAGTQLERLGLEEPLEVVQQICRLMELNSLPVVAVRALRPLINGLINFVESGQLALPNGVPQFGERLREIVNVAANFDLS